MKFFFCLNGELMLNNKVNNFSVMLGGFLFPISKQKKRCLTQEDNTVPIVRLKPAGP